LADLQQTRAAFEAAYPTKSAVETRAALLAIYERAETVRRESLAASAWQPGKDNANCVQAVETMTAIKRLITDHFLPWCDEQIAKNGGTAPESGRLQWVWNSIGLQTDPDTGIKLFTPLFLAPDYYGNACGIELETWDQAVAALPGLVTEEAEKLAEKAASAARVAVPIVGLIAAVVLVSKFTK
jgi:hypothetical protein